MDGLDIWDSQVITAARSFRWNEKNSLRNDLRSNGVEEGWSEYLMNAQHAEIEFKDEKSEENYIFHNKVIY